MFNVSPKRTVLPGFNFRPQDDVPGFNNGLPPRESTGPDELLPGSETPQYPASAQALTPFQPAPLQPPEWPYQTPTMPLPGSPSLVDLLNRGPYGMLINPIEAYPTTGQAQWPSFNPGPAQSELDTRDDPIAAQNANPLPAHEDVMRNTWPPDQDSRYAQVSFAGPRDLSGTGSMWPPTGSSPAFSAELAVDPNLVLANAGGEDVQEAQQQQPGRNIPRSVPQKLPTRAKPSASKQLSGEELTH